MNASSKIPRRKFLAATATASLALAMPRVLTAQKSESTRDRYGRISYEVLHYWAATTLQNILANHS